MKHMARPIATIVMAIFIVTISLMIWWPLLAYSWRYWVGQS
jgi:hypothetical protein